MANSIQTVGRNAAHFNDLDLIAIVSFMIDEVQREPGTYPLMEGLAKEWIRMLAGYGPGTIDLTLDVAASSRESKLCFDRLLSAVDTKIRQFGNVVPSSLLNKQCRVPGILFADYSPVTLTVALDRLRKLVFSS